jgi:hypothetical protein
MTLPKGRALTPEQKRIILESILNSWLKYPEMRLGQLIVNAIRSSEIIPIPLFYIEDNVLEDIVIEFAGKTTEG